VLVAALLVARSCGKTETDVSQEEAIEIAKGQIDFEPTCTFVRFLQRGLADETWAVSLSRPLDAERSLVVVVQVDGQTGDVVERTEGAERLVECRSSTPEAGKAWGVRTWEPSDAPRKFVPLSL
jgi:hypothetical protein